MKALVKRESAVGLWLEDVPEPEIGINDVLIRILKTGICGTDLHIYNWDAWAQATIPVPMVVGHEFVGEIVEVGSNVSDFRVGEIVSGEGHVVCGRCRNCMAGRRHLCAHTEGVGVNRPGAFAEYLSLPMTNVWHHQRAAGPGCASGAQHDAGSGCVSGARRDTGSRDANGVGAEATKRISLDVASIFDPLGNAVHSALSFDLLGEDVLITGAGPIGCMAAAVARHAGARHVVVTDVNEYRLDLARKMGATLAVNVSEKRVSEVQKDLGLDEGFDVGLEMSGHPTAFQQMLNNMCHGGKIALLGIPEHKIELDLNQLIFEGLTLKGIYGREMYETWYKMSMMLESGLDITPVITHRLPYEEFEKGFEVMQAGQCGKVVLDWAAIE